MVSACATGPVLGTGWPKTGVLCAKDQGCPKALALHLGPALAPGMPLPPRNSYTMSISI